MECPCHHTNVITTPVVVPYSTVQHTCNWGNILVLRISSTNCEHFVMETGSFQENKQTVRQRVVIFEADLELPAVTNSVIVLPFTCNTN